MPVINAGTILKYCFRVWSDDINHYDDDILLHYSDNSIKQRRVRLLSMKTSIFRVLLCVLFIYDKPHRMEQSLSKPYKDYHDKQASEWINIFVHWVLHNIFCLTVVLLDIHGCHCVSLLGDARLGGCSKTNKIYHSIIQIYDTWWLNAGLGGQRPPPSYTARKWDAYYAGNYFVVRYVSIK